MSIYFKSIFFVPDYVVLVGESDKNILINTDDPSLVRCTNNTETIEMTSALDVKKRWQCPCGSVGRYVYLFFKNPTMSTVICDIEVYAENTPCSPRLSSEYKGNRDKTSLGPYYLNTYASKYIRF